MLRDAARRWPQAAALWRDGAALNYAALDAAVDQAAAALRVLAPLRGSRVAVWLDKRIDTVVALFAAMRAGHLAVPVNPALRAPQVLDCLADCRAALLLSDGARLQALAGTHGSAGSADGLPRCDTGALQTPCMNVDGQEWRTLLQGDSPPAASAAPARDPDELAILFYTSGSTGAPKGVMVTHANLLAGATAVNAYLGHQPEDRLLAALPLSFDAGFSQLTTAFAAGASVVLLDHLFPADVLAAIERHGVTGLTAVPPLWLQLLRAMAARADHAGEASGRAPADLSGDVTPGAAARPGASLRYIANTGGHLPRAAWQALRQHWPQAAPVAMYGLTEAFRATRLPPEDFDRKPDAIGFAIPGGTRLHVLHADGKPCAVDEPGELVQQGPLVARGYWNDPARSALRFRPGPDGAPAVWSGDTVRRDAEGCLWFVGRDDEQIKTSGYRVSPTEVEAAAAAAGWPECVALGMADAWLGQHIVLVVAHRSMPGKGRPAATDDAEAETDRHASASGGACDTAALLAALRAALPAWMVPRRIDAWPGALPRNANGKFDRVRIRQLSSQGKVLPIAEAQSHG
ncbi:MAG: AMP-binding protein [Rhodocyclaceae bacterium]|nr:AMP-binding protein [Rhodocyclaceae bacterium]